MQLWSQKHSTRHPHTPYPSGAAWSEVRIHFHLSSINTEASRYQDNGPRYFAEMHKLPLSPLHSWGRTGGTAARLIHSLRLSLLHPGHHPHSPSSYERPKNEAGQRLIDFCQENTLVIENTLFQQHKRRLYTWTSPDGQYWNQTDYILCSQRWGNSIQSAKTRPGADCGSDYELFIAKFRLKSKKVGNTTRPFRYDINHIPYDYTVEVTNRFKGLDLIECLKNYGWKFMTLYRRQGSRPSPREINEKRQNGCLRRPYK